MHQSTSMLHPDYIPGNCSCVQMSGKGNLSDLTLKFDWMHWTHNKQLRSRYEVSSLPRLQTEIFSVLQAITTTIIEVNNQLQRKDNDIWSCLYTVSQCGRKIKFDQGFMKLNTTFWTAVHMESLWGSCSATTALQRKSNLPIIHLKVQWRVSYVWQRLLQFVNCCGLRDTDIECSPLNKSSAHCWPNLLQNSTSLSLSSTKYTETSFDSLNWTHYPRSTHNRLLTQHSRQKSERVFVEQLSWRKLQQECKHMPPTTRNARQICHQTG
jgi:hypothetical protein